MLDAWLKTCCRGIKCGWLCQRRGSRSCPCDTSGSSGNWGSSLMIWCACCLALAEGTTSLQSPCWIWPFAWVHYLHCVPIPGAILILKRGKIKCCHRLHAEFAWSMGELLMGTVSPTMWWSKESSHFTRQWDELRKFKDSCISEILFNYK